MGAVAVQIEAKIRETGFKVDVDGCCWAPPAATTTTAVDVAAVETADHDDPWVSADPYLLTTNNRLAESLSEDDGRPRTHWQLRQRRPPLKRRQQRPGDSLSRAHADDHEGGGGDASNNSNSRNNTGENVERRLGRTSDNSHGVEEDGEEHKKDYGAFCRAETAGTGQCRSDSRSLRRQRRLKRERGEAGRFQSAETDESAPFLGLRIDPKNEGHLRLHQEPGTLTMCRRCT